MDMERVSETPLPDWFTDELTAELGKLRCTRKADRARMVKALTRLATHYGATIDAHPSPLNQERGITAYISLNGAYVMIGLDGNSSLHRGSDGQKGGCFLGHWNIESNSDKRYCGYFGSLVGSEIRFHRNKATLAVYGFGQFYLRLAIAFGAIYDGTAFGDEGGGTTRLFG